jgi:hypothetical protein
MGQITWKQTNKGEWVVVGPASILEDAIRRQVPVRVVRKDGRDQKILIEKCGKRFSMKGVEVCYGYLPQRRTGRSAGRLWERRCDRCRHTPDECAQIDCTCPTCGGMMQ